MQQEIPELSELPVFKSAGELSRFLRHFRKTKTDFKLLTILAYKSA